MRLIGSRLACQRGGRRLFESLDFVVEAGQSALLTGPNGAGKTSLLLILAGLLRAEAGHVRLSGAPREEWSLPEDAHLVGHRDALKAQLGVAENLAFARTLLGSPGHAVEAALEAVGLAHLAGTPVAYLSAGQRKRVALARLLVARRPLWLLDEPTAALDAASRGTLTRLMEGHLGTGGMIVAATHEPIGVDAAEIRVGP